MILTVLVRIPGSVVYNYCLLILVWVLPGVRIFFSLIDLFSAEALVKCEM